MTVKALHRVMDEPHRDAWSSGRVVVAEARLASVAADAVIAGLSGSAPVLGVATGSSPLGLYAELADRSLRGDIDLRAASVFALDEYVGLAPDDPRSYAAFVDRHVREPLGIAPDRIHVPPGDVADPETAAEEFEARLHAVGGVDVQIVGIGANGHLAFNEPGSPLESRTRVVDLSPETRAANARFFDDPDEVPRQAVTQGIATVLSASRIVVLAQGEGKAAAVRGAIDGPLDLTCPASALRLHPFVTWVLDPDAASLLRRAR